MDAVKYLRTYREVCNSFDNCQQCSLGLNLCSDRDICPNEYVDAVEKWAKEHPQKTRQSILLDFFTNARMTNGVVNVYPCTIDPLVECNGGDCDQCRREYWREEIE